MPHRCSAPPLALILRAAEFAAHKHRDQRRKDAQASPYINHPLNLARLLADEGGVQDGATLAAALLHDTIEDTDTTAEELTHVFGTEVANLVLEVSDDKTLPKAVRKQAQIDRAALSSPKAKLIKLADKTCNLRDLAQRAPVGWSLQRQREYFDWAAQVVDAVRGAHAGLERLFDAAMKSKP